MRADAQRNRERIIEAARVVFGAQGYDAPLDLVAKQAEVGPGTLYRHFPNRDSLVDAMMQSWMEGVRDTAGKAAAREGSARDVLVEWFADYTGLISRHKGGPAKLTNAMGDCDSPIRTKCDVLRNAMGEVLTQLADDGALPADVDVMQTCRLVGGVAAVADQADLDIDAIRPMLEVVADGMLTARS